MTVGNMLSALLHGSHHTADDGMGAEDIEGGGSPRDDSYPEQDAEQDADEGGSVGDSAGGSSAGEGQGAQGAEDIDMDEVVIDIPPDMSGLMDGEHAQQMLDFQADENEGEMNNAESAVGESADVMSDEGEKRENNNADNENDKEQESESVDNEKEDGKGEEEEEVQEVDSVDDFHTANEGNVDDMRLSSDMPTVDQKMIGRSN
jgi:hypothetical protein